jgi:cytochrome P450
MLYIMTSPQVYAKLQAEVDATPVSTPVISDSQARELPYLQAVIREGLRIFPPGTGLRSKTVPPEGDTIDGVFLPGGTNIGSNTWAVLRLKDVYGDDSDVFRPERWLEATPEKRKEMEQVGDLIFGYGKYRCLGERVAFLEFNKVFFEVRNS